GNIVWEAGYQVWGNLTHEKETRPVQQNLRFQGQYLDRETGLHYNLYRFYDPDIGKFISGDPIGLKGGLNLYSYAPNPLTWIDPLGLERTCSLKNPPKQNKPTEAELDAMSKAVNDILDGKGMPRLDKLGNQKVFGGVLESGQKVDKWKGGLEWDVVRGNNRLRIITKELPNGQTQVGFGHPHWERIFDIVVKNE
ncbi:RHS repeat-associated core domain-containing protein, partial [Salmonella enterica]|uniref:RHS repeat-associated core domain-containing protein n=1 Tax=Salmonella enterica TaxID=28901 RepID=UPI001F513A2B